MKTATVIKVYEIGRHQYDGTNCEKAYRALLSNGRRCWLVGFGADHQPATKSDIENIVDRKAVSKTDDGSYEFELAQSFVGTVVRARIDE